MCLLYQNMPICQTEFCLYSLLYLLWCTIITTSLKYKILGFGGRVGPKSILGQQNFCFRLFLSLSHEGALLFITPQRLTCLNACTNLQNTVRFVLFESTEKDPIKVSKGPTKHIFKSVASANNINTLRALTNNNKEEIAITMWTVVMHTSMLLKRATLSIKPASKDYLMTSLFH